MIFRIDSQQKWSKVSLAVRWRNFNGFFSYSASLLFWLASSEFWRKRKGRKESTWYSSLRVVAGCIAIVNYVLATTIVVVGRDDATEKSTRRLLCDAPAMHCCICARMRREEDQRPSVSPVYFCQRAAITLFTAAAIINSPGNRNFSRLCGWVEINCLDCRRAAMRVPRFARSICSHRISEHTSR